MKKNIILSIIILFALLLVGCNNNEQNSNNSSNSVERLTFENNNSTENNISTNNTQNITRTITGNENSNSSNVTSETNTEKEIATFSTKLLTHDTKREKNIQITCSTLNGHIVKSGETFSFTGTVGKATSERGYQKADTFDANGDKVKALGGGNCQISSTLYNAVLKVDKLEIVERHEHSQKVYYVPEGKDAAVAYGSVDFKFKNNNDFDIKIYAELKDRKINIKLVRI